MADGSSVSAPVAGGGPVGLGPLEVLVGIGRSPSEVGWAVANRGDEAVRVRAVGLVFRVDDVAGPLRVLRHGYQSWSETDVATFGVDQDPSRTAGSIWLSRGMHHADSDVAAEDELRSEQVTVLDDGSTVTAVGFVDGRAHDGTLRIRRSPSGGIELCAEAFLGGAELAPGAQRALHAVVVDAEGDRHELLARWAVRAGAAGQARASSPFQVGWCSWYHYFHDVTEADVRANLALADQWPFDVFQVDDGYQADIGDWLETNEGFPSGLDALARDITASGLTPGIWIAPFIAGPRSRLAAEHPDWIAGWGDGSKPLVGMVNPGWGGSTWTLDTSNPEVLAHLEATAAALVARGWRYLKLDFTYAPSLDGTYANPNMTPAERVRAGFDAIRRGAGDDAFILGCGAPLGATIGAVDGMRIGPDVAPWWEPQTDQWRPPGYVGAEPSTLNAWRATAARAFMHRRLWLNDPDCLMLRTTETRMPADAVRAWADAVASSGGMALISDDLALLDGESRSLLDRVVARGREVDVAASEGTTPVVPDPPRIQVTS